MATQTKIAAARAAARTPAPSTKLGQKVKSLEQRVRSLEHDLAALRGNGAQPETIVLRSVSRDQAKGEIKRLFKSGRVLYYSDVEKELRIDYELVVEICDELMKAGEIMVHADDTVRNR